jgi:hypothetical protein
MIWSPLLALVIIQSLEKIADYGYLAAPVSESIYIPVFIPFGGISTKY